MDPRKGAKTTMAHLIVSFYLSVVPEATYEVACLYHYYIFIKKKDRKKQYPDLRFNFVRMLFTLRVRRSTRGFSKSREGNEPPDDVADTKDWKPDESLTNP